jgi:hypothetical protein
MELKELRKRKKIISVPEEYISNLSLLFTQEKGFLYFPHSDELPQDAQLMAINYRWDHDTFEFAFIHSSFDEVHEGCVAPRMLLDMSKFRFKKERL